MFGVMLRFMKRPLPSSSPYRGTFVPLRAVLPKLNAAWSFLKISGPVFGVIIVKVLVFGMISAAAAEVSAIAAAGHQITFSALYTGAAM
jgi:hypothetical protein